MSGLFHGSISIDGADVSHVVERLQLSPLEAGLTVHGDPYSTPADCRQVRRSFAGGAGCPCCGLRPDLLDRAAVIAEGVRLCELCVRHGHHGDLVHVAFLLAALVCRDHPDPA